MKHKIIVLLILLAGATVVRAQQWHTMVEITYPAELELPMSVSELLLVNNTVAHPDVPMGAFYTLMAASEMLEGSDYLPAVLETSQNMSGSLYVKQLLSNAQADSLLNAYESDALLVLNQLIVHPSSECFQTENEEYYACTQVVAASHWTLFFRTGEQDSTMRINSRTLAYNDTLYWENEGDTWNDAVQALPSAEEARNEMCVYVGEHFAERLLPQVETDDRYLYDLGEKDEGIQYFARKQWQQAIDAWSQPQKNKKLTAYAAANCAVAYEIIGDLSAAYAAAGKALNAFESMRNADARQQAVNISYYQERLRVRMAR
jgi:hypothetical protein